MAESSCCCATPRDSSDLAGTVADNGKKKRASRKSPRGPAPKDNSILVSPATLPLSTSQTVFYPIPYPFGFPGFGVLAHPDPTIAADREILQESSLCTSDSSHRALRPPVIVFPFMSSASTYTTAEGVLVDRSVMYRHPPQLNS